MAKNLVIVESPAKWKTIEKFLGSDFKVVASMWHIRDLPEKSLWIEIEEGFRPEYWVNPDKKKTVDNLIKLAKASKEVWIATDEDREGEAIWWHLCYVLWLDPKTAKRITFHEITKSAISEAIKTPRHLNMELVDAQQARRILDRLVWYKVSPILWKKIRKWLSAWRVQSVAVKLIVEKEREIKDFKPEESWKISVELDYNWIKVVSVLNKVWWKVKKFKNKEDVEKFLNILFEDLKNLKETKNKKWNSEISISDKINFKLVNSTKKDSKRTPLAPFTTSTLQQEASRKFGFWVKQTMMIAQKLYEWIDIWDNQRQGLITYMRTDSVNLSDLAKNQAKQVIEENFWKNYHKLRNYKTKTAWAQEAHEAIRPTDLTKTPESLSSFLDAQQLKLYTLIWKRTLASQMSDAIVEISTFTFSPENFENQEWITKWEVIKFDWFMKLYIESKDDEDEENEENSLLPNISIWEILPSKKLSWVQSFTRPPARYTEASLVKKLESEAIWRPSTYAPTISTIIDRGYVEKVDKNENLKKIIESDSDVKLPKDARYAKFLRVILGPFFRFYFKYKCIDKENIKDGAGIIVGNHQSYLDGFMVNNVFTTKEMNDNYYIATALHFKSKTMKYLANHGNIILVDANRNLKNTLQAAAKVLKNNKKLIIFPEGARTRDGQLHEFKKTFAILAKDLNVPIYPFVLKGAYEAFPYNKKFPKRNNVSVQFLERIEPNNKTVEELVEETKNNIAKNYY